MTLQTILRKRIVESPHYRHMSMRVAALKDQMKQETAPMRNYELYSKDPDRLFESMAATGEAIVEFRLGLPFGFSRRCFVFNDGDLFRQVMVEKGVRENYQAATEGLKAFTYLIGNSGVLMRTGPRHKELREIMRFNQEELGRAISIMQSEAKKSVYELNHHLNKDIDLVEMAYHFTMRVLGKAILGIEDIDPYIAPTRKAIERGLTTAFPKTQSAFPWTLLFNPVFLYDSFMLSHVISCVISERMRDSSWENGKDLAAKLLKMHYLDQMITYEEVVDNLKTMLIAGHETTASSLIWFFYVLDKNRKYQDDDVYRFLYEETSPLSSTNLGLEDRKKLDRTFSVLEDTMRLFPTAPRTARIAIKDNEIGGKLIPAGSIIFFSNRDRQRNPLVWGNPYEFDKKRFISADGGSKKWDHAPFGGGDRKCLGDMFARWEMAIFIKELVGSGLIVEIPQQIITQSSEFTSKIRKLTGRIRLLNDPQRP